jgi:hypothetical protein
MRGGYPPPEAGMYKRPRTDQGYGPPPMMDPHYAAGPGGYGPPGMGMEAGYGAPGYPGSLFPCVKLRGLPFDISDDDVRMFLVSKQQAALQLQTAAYS